MIIYIFSLQLIYKIKLFLNENKKFIDCPFKKYIEKLLPVRYQLSLRYFYSQKANKLDAEMAYVSNLLKEKRRFLDIGANIGIYSFHFKDSFKSIDAFEPLKEISYRLEHFQNPSFKVHNCALSNKRGEFKIYIPYLSQVYRV